MLLIVNRNESEHSWTVQREDQLIPVIFHDKRDVVATALLLGAVVRTADPAIRDICHHLAVQLEDDPLPDYDEYGT